MNTYEVVILGGGPAGYVGALRAAQKGASVALIEKANPGGVCLNEGCIPTKALLDVCHSAHRTEVLSGHGLIGKVDIDLGAAVRKKNLMVSKLRGGIGGLLKSRGVEVIRGSGTIVAPGEITVEGAGSVGYRKLIIATGSSPIQVPSLPFDGTGIISSKEALDLEAPPESILIVGGGFIGCEFADLFSILGCAVTLVEMLPGILPEVDPVLANMVRKGLESAGAEILVETRVEGATGNDEILTVQLSSGQSLEAEKILVAVGRRPNVDIGDLGALGIDASSGRIDVDEHCAAAPPDVYAAGDVTGKWMLAHVASKEAEVAVDNMLGNESEIDYSAVPQCVFTTPEISSVGLTEAAAAEEGIEIRTATFPYAALGRAVVTGDDEGLVKLVAGTDGDVLGMQVAGRGASEMVSLGGLAIQVGATVEDLSEMLMMHPTFSEAVREAADMWLGRPLHTGG